MHVESVAGLLVTEMYASVEVCYACTWIEVQPIGAALHKIGGKVFAAQEAAGQRRDETESVAFGGGEGEGVFFAAVQAKGEDFLTGRSHRVEERARGYCWKGTLMLLQAAGCVVLLRLLPMPR